MLRNALTSLVAIATLFGALSAEAATDAGAPKDAGARTAMPAGHPTVGDGGLVDAGPLPIDESDVEEGADPHQGGDPHGGDPHQHGGKASIPGMFEAPPDTTDPDPRIPRGTIVVEILDAEGKAVPNAPITLGILQNSVAKGESRKRVMKIADAAGRATFDGLETGSGIAYRVTAPVDEATFAATPFQLGEEAGVRARVHRYDVTRNLADAMVVAQVVVAAEVKDDRIQIQQLVSVWNFGKTAWVPEDFVMPLPPDFTAFSTQQGMSDVGVDVVEKKGVRLRGTIGPGRHEIQFRWQLPYSGEREVTFDIGMPPHVAVARVMAPSSREMRLEATGFPPPDSRTDEQGQKVLVTERQMRRDEAPLTSLHLALKDLPTQGPGRYIATGLATFGVLAGLSLAFSLQRRRAKASDVRETRARLRDELLALEKARESGDIGPKTYERARRELFEELALTFAER